eukprot:jgi/Chlat1/3312/Chrsp22S03471
MGVVASSIANRLAYYPPRPATYSLVRDETNPGGWCFDGVPPRPDLQVVKIANKRGDTLAACFIRRKNARFTLLFSHGNAVDLGQMRPFLLDLSAALNVNILGYDYTGYGTSTGSPCEVATYADIEACYAWLQEKGTREQDIVLYGQSVGSGPSTHLAALSPNLGGLVLHSPLLSGIRVLHPNTTRTYPFDIYKNVDKISKVACPVLVLHGTTDEVINIAHGQRLAQLCQQSFKPLWVVGGTHCDLEASPLYLPRLREYIAHLSRL